MANGGQARKNGNGANIGFEAELFQAADKLRGNLEPSEYKHVALGLIFLKYISDAFEAKRAELEKEDSSATGGQGRIQRRQCVLAAERSAVGASASERAPADDRKADR